MDCPGCKLVDAHIEMDELPDGRLRCCRCGRIEEVEPSKFFKDLEVD